MNYKEALEKNIKEIAEKFGLCNIYYVGGYVRDELLDKYFPNSVSDLFKDVDLVIDMENGASEFIKFLKSNCPDKCKDFAEYPRFGTAKFTLAFDGMTRANGQPWIREESIEVVSPRTEKYEDGPRKPSSVKSASIKEDAMRRDFCCNALYKNVVTGEILDPTGRGIDDVKNKILRTPLDPTVTYKDDPLRMLRVIRFAAKKGFDIEENTFKALSPIPEYYQLSMERVNSEFTQIMSSPNPSKYIWMLHDTGLLGYIIPELEEAWGFNQNSKYHSMNLTDHSLSVLNYVIRRSNYGGKSEEIKTRLAALLHDISKYKIHETNSDGTFSYHNHEENSADMARNILVRLKYPNEVVDDVCLMIRSHMKIKSQYDYSTKSYTGTKKSMGKFIRSVSTGRGERADSDMLGNILRIIDADNLSHNQEWNMPGQIDSFWWKWDKWFGKISPVGSSIKNPVSGKDIMDRFGLKPGKMIGYIKDEIIFDFSIEHPDYDKETLLDMYEAEFGEGRKVYVWRGDFDKFYASIVEPYEAQTTRNISTNPYYDIEDYRDRYELNNDEKEELLGDKPLVELSALEYPELYVRIRIHKRSREILDKVWDELEELQEMPGFEKVSLDLDSSNDVSARIDWKNHRSDYIW